MHFWEEGAPTKRNLWRVGGLACHTSLTQVSWIFNLKVSWSNLFCVLVVQQTTCTCLFVSNSSMLALEAFASLSNPWVLGLIAILTYVLFFRSGKKQKIVGSVFVTGYFWIWQLLNHSNCSNLRRCDSGMGEITAERLASLGFYVFAGNTTIPAAFNWSWHWLLFRRRVFGG